MILSFKKRCGKYRLMEDVKLRVKPDPANQWSSYTRLFNKLMMQKAEVDSADPHLFTMPRGTVINIAKIVEYDGVGGPRMQITISSKDNMKKHPWLNTSILLRDSGLWDDVELDVEVIS